ncbi:MAG: alpha-L-arabinofuranosidase C-terminal domain-containing protein [candidate division FCPU426 bacterium]
MAKLSIHADKPGPIIDPNIYGHFSEHLGRCIYEGIWVGKGSKIPNVRGIRKDVVAALKKIKIPVLRWPGGCFADEYHWQDGIGPHARRPTVVNTHWGGVTENNHFGTHEFLDLCEQLGTEPYISGNVGSGSVREMSQWVEYVNFGGKSPMSDLRKKHGRKEPWKVRYWGVGNESWGCGGNMRPEYYADQYRHFQTFCRDYPDRGLFKIACGANNDDYAWTEKFLATLGPGFIKWPSHIHGLSLHRYIVPNVDGKRGRALEFEEEGWAQVMAQSFRFDAMIKKHQAIMDKYDPDKRVAIIFDEWGTWYDVEEGQNPGFLYQQNSLRDAVSAAVVLNTFNNHADRVKMANIAQTINVLQAMILTDGAKILLTPSYHVFDLYSAHQGARLVPTEFKEARGYRFGKHAMPALSASASLDAAGCLNLSLANPDPSKEMSLEIDLKGYRAGKASVQVLSGPKMSSHNSFNGPEAVRPSRPLDLGNPSKGLKLQLAPRSVNLIRMTPLKP